VSLHDEAAAVGSVGITALIEKERPWQEKWHEVEAVYHDLAEVYRGGAAPHPQEWRRIALSFFQACHELPEAIAGDSAVPTPTSRRIRRSAERPDVLKLVADVDNTRKHGGRDPDKCHARVGEISWGDHGTPTMRILRECPNSPVERVDVRDAATEAMDVWRAILSRHGLTP
jgi:hypothetical protein